MLSFFFLFACWQSVCPISKTLCQIFSFLLVCFFDVELLEMCIYGCQHLIGYIISYYLQIFSLNKQTIFHFIDDFLYCAKAFKFS